MSSFLIVLSVKAYRVCLQQMVFKTQNRLSFQRLHLSKQTVSWFWGLKRTTCKQKRSLCLRNHLDFFKLGRSKHQWEWTSSSYSTLPPEPGVKKIRMCCRWSDKEFWVSSFSGWNTATLKCDLEENLPQSGSLLLVLAGQSAISNRACTGTCKTSDHRQTHTFQGQKTPHIPYQDPLATSTLLQYRYLG